MAGWCCSKGQPAAHVASQFAVPQVTVALPHFIHYLKFKGSFDLIKTWGKHISCVPPLFHVKLTPWWLFKMCCLQFFFLFDWHLEIAEVDGKGLFAHSVAGGGCGAKRKKSEKIEWDDNLKSSSDDTCSHLWRGWLWWQHPLLIWVQPLHHIPMMKILKIYIFLFALGAMPLSLLLLCLTIEIFLFFLSNNFEDFYLNKWLLTHCLSLNEVTQC